MKKLFLASLVLSSSAFAAKKIEVTGYQTATLMAPLCGKETFKAFVDWGAKNKFFDSVINVEDAPDVTYTEGSVLTVSIEGKNYQGSDICDVAMNYVNANTEVTSKNILNFSSVLPTQLK